MSNPNGKSPQDSYLKTKKKGNVTVNPKKEDLMSELFQKNLKNALAEIKQQAKQSIKEAEASVTANTDTATDKPATDKKKKADPNAAKGDSKPNEPVACEEIDDTQAKKEIAERMRQRLVALTQEHDKKYMIDIADPK
jgi:DNA mismatch repair ATPase MutL